MVVLWLFPFRSQRQSLGAACLALSPADSVDRLRGFPVSGRLPMGWRAHRSVVNPHERVWSTENAR